MFLAYLLTGVLLCVPIIGIPLGLANSKLIPVSLFPLGQGHRVGVAGELQRRAPPRSAAVDGPVAAVAVLPLQVPASRAEVVADLLDVGQALDQFSS